MIQPWVSLLVSAITGGLMGTILSILYNLWSTRRLALAKERGTIAALASELRHSRLICDQNEILRSDSTAPLIRFPTTVALNATFVERHCFPQLAGLQEQMEAYTLGILQVNQMIDLHHRLWHSPELPSGTSKGAEGRREEMRFKIADLCSGTVVLGGVQPEKAVALPTLIETLLKCVDHVKR